ncbi:hypothetical protein H1Q63_21250 [Desmonostoc muscorum CCALA 125]|nr:hypothetical protein [Desmonostoc muscorum CCALA 125]
MGIGDWGLGIGDSENFSLVPTLHSLLPKTAIVNYPMSWPTRNFQFVN